MNQTDPSVSSPALRLVLDALETEGTHTRRSLAEATRLSDSTVSRAIRLGIRRGLLIRKEGADPVSGRPCRHILPAPGLLIPLLSLYPHHGSLRVLNPGLIPEGSTSVELNPAFTPEENLRLLCRRGLPLLRGMATRTGLSVTSPILVSDKASAPAATLAACLTDTVGLPPLLMPDRDDCIARALSAGALPQKRDAASALFMRVGNGDHACILLRTPQGGWTVSSLGHRLTPGLRRTLPASNCPPELLRRSVIDLLAELCRFLSPDIILLEDARGILPTEEEWRRLLPEGSPVVILSPGEGGLTLAERGAALLGRRALWDRILEASPPSGVSRK